MAPPAAGLLAGIVMIRLSEAHRRASVLAAASPATQAPYAHTMQPVVSHCIALNHMVAAVEADAWSLNTVTLRHRCPLSGKGCNT